MLSMKPTKPMNITLDVWGAGSNAPRGVVQQKRQYAKACTQLVQRGDIRLHYAGSDPDHEWLLKEGLLDYGVFHRFRVPGRLQQMAADLKIEPLNLLLGNPDIFHSFTLYPFQRGRMRVVGTLIDFVPMRVPEFVPLEMLKQQVIWCQWASKHPSAAWITSSEQIKQDAMALARLQSEQVVIAKFCADDDVFLVPTDQDVNKTLGSLGINRPYLLCVNTFNPRKNHGRLLEAWEKGQFSKQGWSLVLVGHPAGNPLTDRLRSGEYSGASWLGYLPRHQIIHLYYGCDAFVYPSLYEGFGTPVAEAVVAGKAVLTSLRSPMAETAGSGAIYVDPWDTSSIEKGLSALINDEDMRCGLSVYNFSNRRMFSIGRLAEDLLTAYRELII
jgi:glycosyltransferase involved in cell wall biosynthesis